MAGLGESFGFTRRGVLHTISSEGALSFRLFHAWEEVRDDVVKQRKVILQELWHLQ